MHNPLEPHWQVVKRIPRYLKHTISTRLFLSWSHHSAIQAFSDSDWADDRDDRRSISAYCVFMGNNLISWRCKQQFTVARSSTKAGYKSLADTASELQWLQSTLSEIGLKIPTPQCYGVIILEPHTWLLILCFMPVLMLVLSTSKLIFIIYVTKFKESNLRFSSFLLKINLLIHWQNRCLHASFKILWPIWMSKLFLSDWGGL